jgi:AcrR family transcriptional regulator
MTSARLERPDPEHATAARIAGRATELFANKGFAGTSVREIAEAAGVTKPTVYYYFESKEGLVRHIMQTAMGQLLESVHAAKALGGDIRAQLCALVQAQLEFAASHPAAIALMGRLHHEPPGQPWGDELQRLQEQAFAAVGSLFKQAIARGEIAARDPMLLTLTLFGALISHTTAVLRCEPDPNATTAPRVASQLVDLLLLGARPRPPVPGEPEPR